MRGIEPLTPSLPRKYSTPELHRLKPTHKPKTFAPGFPNSNNSTYYSLSYASVFLPTYPSFQSSSIFYRAGDEARTRDLQLGRLSLYQLSYSRIIIWWGEKDSNLRNRSNGFTVRPI